MLSLLCITLPCAMSILYAILFSMKERTNTNTILLALSASASVYFFAELNYISTIEDYSTFVVADIASQYARPLIPPLMVLCLHSLMGKIIWRWWMTLAFALSIIIGTVSMCVCVIIGFDNVVNYVETQYNTEGNISAYQNRIYLLYEIFCVWIYRITIVIYSIICIARISYLFHKTQFKLKEIPDFLFRKGEIEPAHLMGLLYIIVLTTIFIKLTIGRYWFVDHQCCASLFCLLRTALVFLIGLVGVRNQEPTLTLHSLRTTPIRHTPTAPSPHIPISTPIPNSPIDIPNSPIDIPNFTEIHTNHLYLNPHLTIESVADKLGTNRTYLSRYITDRYGVSFREYINGLRIEYSKQYMMQNPTHKQEVVAEECGFADAPQFNKKFKQMVGKSPRMWVVMQG